MLYKRANDFHTFFFKMSCDIRSRRLLPVAHFVCLSPDWAIMFLQVAARTEIGVRRRTQAMSRSCSKRKSRFSSLWGLDTTSKKKTKAHPSINQVCTLFFIKFKTDLWNCLGRSPFFLCHLSSAILLQLWQVDLLFVSAGLCWWWWLSEKTFRWHICWSCQGTHSKKELIRLHKFDSEL